MGSIGVNGQTVFPFPIPAMSSLVGFNVYGQALLHSAGLGRYMASNAFVVSIGH